MVRSNDQNNTNTYNTRSKKSREEDKKKNLKKGCDSDSSDDDELSTGSGSDSEEEINMKVYKKILNKSDVLKKLASSKNSKSKKKDDSKNKDDNKKSSKKKSKNKKKAPIVESEDESEEDSDFETIEDSDEEYDDDGDDDEIINVMDSKKSKKGFNIIFTIGDPLRDEDEDEDDDEDYDEDEDEDEEEDDSDSDESDDEKDIEGNKVSFESKMKQIETVRETLNKILESDAKNKIAIDGLKELDRKEKKLKKYEDKMNDKIKTKNVKKFRNLVNQRSLMNDFKFFKEKLSVDEQQKIIHEVEEINKVNLVQKPYRLSLLECDIPANLKAIALNKISSLRFMDPGSGEYYKIKNWVDTFMQIPFNNFKSLPLTIHDGVDKCSEYMDQSKQILDEAVYGLDDAKMQIMQMIGQWISNPKAVGTAIAIKGPMGTGKTTLVKEGISKILNRDFAFLALGGATDSSFLEGHGYTYEGSTWGKVVDILIKSKSMNPVIYFDELDKISETPKGEEIAGILTHLTDTSQNSQFHDKYFSEIDFDLSKCLFIFSYNDESKVNPILLDRMYKIQTQGYEKKDKRVISNQYLIPKIQEQVNFNKEDIIIPDETIDYIVETYTEKEKGVRNLKRCLEVIYTKLNLYRLMKPESKLFEKETTLKVEFPFTVTSEIVKKLIKKDEPNTSLYGLYV